MSEMVQEARSVELEALGNGFWGIFGQKYTSIKWRGRGTGE